MIELLTTTIKLTFDSEKDVDVIIPISVIEDGGQMKLSPDDVDWTGIRIIPGSNECKLPVICNSKEFKAIVMEILGLKDIGKPFTLANNYLLTDSQFTKLTGYVLTLRNYSNGHIDGEIYIGSYGGFVDLGVYPANATEFTINECHGILSSHKDFVNTREDIVSGERVIHSNCKFKDLYEVRHIVKLSEGYSLIIRANDGTNIQFNNFIAIVNDCGEITQIGLKEDYEVEDPETETFDYEAASDVGSEAIEDYASVQDYVEERRVDWENSYDDRVNNYKEYIRRQKDHNVQNLLTYYGI